jgi:hypothetical protein
MEDTGIFYGHLVNFRPFGILYGTLVYFMALWYILWHFGIPIFHVLVYITTKNLAALLATKNLNELRLLRCLTSTAF